MAGPVTSGLHQGLGWLALGCAVAAAVGFGTLLEGYRQAIDPLALLGASGVPRAAAFNLLGFVVPGLLAAGLALALRRALPEGARWSARIGATLVLLAALAFAAQGLLPLDPDDIGAVATQGHAAAWTLWWLAFVAGAGALGWGLRGGALAGLALPGLLAATAVLMLAAVPWPAAWAGVLQRGAFVAWLGWLPAAGAAIDAARRARARGSVPCR